MPIISDNAKVLKLAQKLQKKEPEGSPDAIAAKALRQFYGLAPSDGIWGTSDAAIRMGYRGRSEDEDLFDEVARDLAAKLGDLAPV